MASVYDINLLRGTSLVLTLVAKDSSNNLLNLSGYSVRGSVKNRFSDTGSLLNLSPTIDTSYVSGLVLINVSGAATESLPITRCKYDVEIYNNSGYVLNILKGDFFVDPQVT
jgi:hypothetical protein